MFWFCYVASSFFHDIFFSQNKADIAKKKKNEYKKYNCTEVQLYNCTKVQLQFADFSTEWCEAHKL